MRKKTEFITTGILIIALGLGGCNSLKNCKNGEYEGVGKGNNGDIKVKVEVNNGKISKIDVIEQIESTAMWREVKENLIPQILEENSLKVDTISGATKSTNGVIEAITKALESSKN
ncbi:MAG: FMN-binding protein [Clostridium sp.]